MITTHASEFTKDPANKKITVKRKFNAPVELVWKAWSDAALLDKWWAPKPYKAVTKKMDFREGGQWMYYMLGPDGSKSYCKLDYKKIETLKSFNADDYFCDENGMANNDMPRMDWTSTFSAEGEGSYVLVNISFGNEADLNKLLEMGFKEGFDMGLGNLDELLETMR